MLAALLILAIVTFAFVPYIADGIVVYKRG